jgi:hypothetical protein
MKEIPKCFECGEDGQQTGRYTWYCPSCNVCPECGCPDADGFQHYAGCYVGAETQELEDQLAEQNSDYNRMIERSLKR